jgi:predicted transcriptional regulator
MQRRYGTHLKPRRIRQVWAAVTRNPRASKRELSEELGLSFGAIGGALRFLKDAGYIEFPKGACRAITVVVPFYVEELQ